MKTKNKFIFPLFAVVMFFASCSDMLDKQPFGQFSTAQMDSTSVNGLMASAYAGLEGHFFGNNESFWAPYQTGYLICALTMLTKVVVV